MGRVVITVEWSDGRPSKSTEPMHPEDATSAMRDLMFRCAVGEFAAVYVTEAKPLDFKQFKREQLTD